MDNKLSVIIPVYNVEEYLEQCVESVLKQNYSSFEVILVDDGSTDQSGSICDRYAAADNRIRVMHQPNQGHTIARQNGFKVSDGNYVIFIDSDDWIDDGMFEAMMNKAVAEDADIVQCGFRAVRNEMSVVAEIPNEEGLYSKEHLQEKIYPTMIWNKKKHCFGIAPNMWNKIFRRTLIEKYIYQIDSRIRSGEDGLLTYSCFLNAQRFYNLHSCFYNYRSREKSMCRITDDRRLDENHLLFQYYQKWFMPEEVLHKSIDYYVVSQTIMAVKELMKKKSIFQIKKEHPYLRQDSIEWHSIQNLKLRDIKGKKNKLILLGLKL